MDEYEEYEQNERFQEMLEYMERRHTDHVIVEAEESLTSVQTEGSVPTPNTAHPVYASRAKFVRQLGQRGHVKLLKPTRAAAQFVEPDQFRPIESISTSQIVLEMRRFSGPAPFVGDPLVEVAYYGWTAWVDLYGRYVSSDAELRWVRR